jgi:hypothetical protein
MFPVLVARVLPAVTDAPRGFTVGVASRAVPRDSGRPSAHRAGQAQSMP